MYVFAKYIWNYTVLPNKAGHLRDTYDLLLLVTDQPNKWSNFVNFQNVKPGFLFNRKRDFIYRNGEYLVQLFSNIFSVR
jgi:hypothetical protein